MARKAGQLISRGPRAWLVRVSLIRSWGWTCYVLDCERVSWWTVSFR
jgi:hypothetical protein